MYPKTRMSKLSYASGASRFNPEQYLNLLPDNQLQAAKLLARNIKQKEVAERVGVSSRTIRNWMGDITFRYVLKNLTYLNLKREIEN